MLQYEPGHCPHQPALGWQPVRSLGRRSSFRLPLVCLPMRLPLCLGYYTVTSSPPERLHQGHQGTSRSSFHPSTKANPGQGLEQPCVTQRHQPGPQSWSLGEQVWKQGPPAPPQGWGQVGNAQRRAWLGGEVALPSLEHQPAQGTGQHRAAFTQAQPYWRTAPSRSQSVVQNQNINFVKGGRQTENSREWLGEAQS